MAVSSALRASPKFSRTLSFPRTDQILARKHRARMATEMKKLLACIPMLALTASNTPDLAQLDQMIARFAPTELRADVSNLSPGDRKTLAKLIEASRTLNDIFLKQMWSGNLELFEKLKRDTTPLGKARLHYFWIDRKSTRLN